MMGKINGDCCHCSELARRTSCHPDNLENYICLLIPAVITEKQKAERRTTATAENQTKEEPLSRWESAVCSHSQGAWGISQSLQGPSGCQNRKTVICLLLKMGRDRRHRWEHSCIWLYWNLWESMAPRKRKKGNGACSGLNISFSTPFLFWNPNPPIWWC